MKTEQEARTAAENLLALMTSTGWATHVWYNLTWCYCITKLGASVHDNEDGTYTCYLNDELKQGGTPMFWVDNNTYDNPNTAFEQQIQLAKGFVHRLSTVLQAYI